MTTVIARSADSEHAGAMRILVLFIALLTGIMPAGAQECLSRQATYRVSSQFGTEYVALPSLLTGQGPLHQARLAPSGQTAEEFAFHTALEQNPHLIVDLGEAAWIDTLKLENRRRQCQQRAVGLQAWFSYDGQVWSPPVSLGDPRSDWVYPVQPRRLARYVKLGLVRRDYLHLAHLEIWGKPAAAPSPASLEVQVAPSSTSQTFTSPEGLRVTLPSVARPTTLRISPVTDAPAPEHPEYWVPGQTFDIRLGSARLLSQEIQIEIPLERLKQNAEVVRFDEERGLWVEVPSAPSADGRRLVARTRHLCCIRGLTLLDESPPRFSQVMHYGDRGQYSVKVFWTETARFRQQTMTFNRDYAQGSYPRDFPPYVKHTLRWAHRSASTYYQLGFRPYAQSIHYYLEDVPNSQQLGLTKNIEINFSVVAHQALDVSADAVLGYVVAHETFHNFQSADYSLGGTLMRRWWMEATAEYAASRVVQPAYRLMGKLDNISAVQDLARFLSRAPLFYAYQPKGWFESLDWTVGLSDWHRRHAYRGAHFIDYLCRVGAKRRGSTPPIEFREMWKSLAAGGDLDSRAGLDTFLKQRYAGLDFEQFYRHFAFFIWLHQDSPLCDSSRPFEIPPTAMTSQHVLKASDPTPVVLTFPCLEGPRSELVSVSTQRDVKLECRLLDPVPPPENVQVWLFQRPLGQRLGGAQGRGNLWEIFDGNALAPPQTIELKKDHRLMVVALQLGGDAGPFEALPPQPPLRLQLRPLVENQGGWERVGPPKITVRKATASAGHECKLDAGDGQVVGLWGGPKGRLLATLEWPSLPLTVPDEGTLSLSLNPALNGTVAPGDQVLGQVFVQMAQITPAHRSVAAFHNQQHPGPTTFKIDMPKIYAPRPITLPISILYQSKCGDVNITYDYRWTPR